MIRQVPLLSLNNERFSLFLNLIELNFYQYKIYLDYLMYKITLLILTLLILFYFAGAAMSENGIPSKYKTNIFLYS